MTTYGHQLACWVSIKFSIGLAKETKPIRTMPSFIFLEKLIIKDKNKTLLEAIAEKSNLKLGCDRFKLENRGIRAAIV